MQHNIVCELNNYISLVGELCVIAHDKSTTRIFKAMTTKPCLNNNQIDSSWEWPGYIVLGLLRLLLIRIRLVL